MPPKDKINLEESAQWEEKNPYTAIIIRWTKKDVPGADVPETTYKAQKFPPQVYYTEAVHQPKTIINEALQQNCGSVIL